MKKILGTHGGYPITRHPVEREPALEVFKQLGDSVVSLTRLYNDPRLVIPAKAGIQA